MVGGFRPFPSYLCAVLLVFTTIPCAHGGKLLDELPLLPKFDVPKKEKGHGLPPLPLPKTPSVEGMIGGQDVFLTDYRLTGNQILSDQELGKFIRPYIKRRISFSDLIKRRDKLTLAYVSRGYLTSGSLIPKINNGILDIQIIVGVVNRFEITIDGRLRKSYIHDRLVKRIKGPLNIHELGVHLEILQQNDRIESIQAELLPTKKQGEAALQIHIREAKSYLWNIEINNYESPAVGGEQGLIGVSHKNVTGYGDWLTAAFSQSRGLSSISTRYRVPINANDTSIEIGFEQTESKVIENSFKQFNIKSRARAYGLTLHYSGQARFK